MESFNFVGPIFHGSSFTSGNKHQVHWDIITLQILCTINESCTVFYNQSLRTSVCVDGEPLHGLHKFRWFHRIPHTFNLSIPIRTQTQCVKTIFLHCSNLIQLFKELEHCPLLTNLRRVLDFFFFLLFLYFYIKYLEIWQTNISDWVSQIMMTLEHKRELPVPVIF